MAIRLDDKKQIGSEVNQAAASALSAGSSRLSRSHC